MATHHHSFLKRFFTFIGILILLSNCSKDKTDCWDFYFVGNQTTGTVCGKTEEEMRAVYGNLFDRTSAAKFCWKANYSSYFVYIEDVSEKIVALLYPDAITREKVPCGYCQVWECFTKRYYKPTGSGQSIGGYLQYPCGDTCATLYPHREVFLYETADSIWKVVWYKRLH